jgi:phage minor structural protein
VISVYSGSATSFGGNGQAVLVPTAATVRQVAGGEYSFTMEHPIDPWGKWKYLLRENIVKLPVPKEIIQPASVGYDADVYVVTVNNAALREGPSEPTTITYTAWSETTAASDGYSPGSKVTFGNKNYQCIFWDSEQTLRKRVVPSSSSWWTTIPRTTAGASVLATLKTGTKLYLTASYDTNWYEMETTYGLSGYIKKNQVTFDHHITPSELQPRVITEQLFRIKEVTVDRKSGTVSLSGNHVSNDLNGVLVQAVKLSKVTPAMAIGRITEAFMQDYRGDIGTDMTTDDDGTYTGEIKLKNGMFCLTDPDVGIVHYFNAKFTRDNWDLFIMTRSSGIGSAPYEIRYGYNVNGIIWKVKSSGLITRVVPVAKDENGEALYLPETYVDSSYINNYPVIYMEALNVKGQVGKDDGTDTDTTWTKEALLTEMRTKAGERFSVDLVDIPSTEVTVQLEQLENTAEYAWLKDLAQTLNLYDSVLVKDTDIGLNVGLDVKEIEYDCIKKKISGLKLSNRIYDDESTVAGYNIMNGALTENKLSKSAADSLITDAVNQVLSIIEE